MIEAESGQLQDVELLSRERETRRTALGKLTIQCRGEGWMNELMHVNNRPAGGCDLTSDDVAVVVVNPLFIVP